MCVYSMVVDHYQDRFRPFMPVKWPSVPNPLAPIDADAFEKLTREFREALEAAKKVDALTKQPDCEDPEKAKLVDRVAALEKELAELKAPRKKKRRKPIKRRSRTHEAHRGR